MEAKELNFWLGWLWFLTIIWALVMSSWTTPPEKSEKQIPITSQKAKDISKDSLWVDGRVYRNGQKIQITILN